jgi:hypothetical protein
LYRSLVTSIGVAALVAPGAGCFRVAFESGAIACGEAGCPLDYVCGGDGRCYRAGAAIPDAAVAPDAAALPTCGKTLLLHDDFADGLRGGLWNRAFETAPVTSEAAGQLAFAVPAGESAAYLSWPEYDLRESRVRVEVLLARADPGGEVHLGVDVRTPAGPGIEARLAVAAGELRALADRGSGDELLMAVPYQPAQHRFWQLREQGGALFWETSVDGTSFQPLASRSTFFPAGAVAISLGAAAAVTGTGSAEARFDNLNDSAPAGEHCSLAALGSDFPAGAVPVWAELGEQAGCRFVADGAGARFRFTGAGRCALRSRAPVRFTGGALAIDLIQPLATTQPGQVSLSLATLGGAQVIALQRGGELLLRVTAAGGGAPAETAAAYDPTLHRFLRLREMAGMVVLEGSSDGASFGAVASMPHGLGGEPVEVELATETPGVASQTDVIVRAVIGTP